MYTCGSKIYITRFQVHRDKQVVEKWRVRYNTRYQGFYALSTSFLSMFTIQMSFSLSSGTSFSLVAPMTRPCSIVLLFFEHIVKYLLSNFCLYILNLSDCHDGWCVIKSSSHSSSLDINVGTNTDRIFAFFASLRSILSSAEGLLLDFWKTKTHSYTSC